MGRDTIENTLFNLYKVSITDSRALEYNAIAWYVETCRASVDFIRTLGKANPRKLLKNVSAGQTDEDIIDRTKKYLARYCGYLA